VGRPEVVAERIYPPRTHGEAEPPSALAEKLAWAFAGGAEKTTAEEAIHWVWRTDRSGLWSAGGLLSVGDSERGSGVRMALNSLTHGTRCRDGLAAEPEDQTVREKTMRWLRTWLWDGD